MKYSLDTNLGKSPQEGQRIYDHFTQLVSQQSSEQLLSEFQGFWIDGTNSPDETLDLERENLLSYKVPQESFNLCLYQCCQILIEAWQKQPETEAAIPKLMNLLFQPPSADANAYWRSRSVLRLNERLQAFRKSDQANSLQHFFGLLQPTPISINQLETKPLKSLLYRYPYLYSYSLMSEDSSSLSHSVRRIKAVKTKEFETNLSQYVIDQVRRRNPEPSQEKSHQKNARKFFSKNNPTFLSDKELNRALQEYLGKVDGTYTNRDLAQTFSSYSKTQIQYYGDFKKIFHQYLTKNLTSSYSRQFNPLLQKQLDSMSPTKTDDRISDFLMMRTCTDILNFLVVETTPPHKHLTFMNLISNLGAIRTTSLLMKVLLICPQARPQLEKQLWILFKSYQDSPCNRVKGLIKIWENYNVALAAYFGKADLSWCLQIPRAK